MKEAYDKISLSNKVSSNLGINIWHKKESDVNNQNLNLIRRKECKIMEKKAICLLSIISVIFIGIASVVLGAGEEFPTKLIELYCPFGAGGGTSMGARVVAGAASEILGRPVVVVNKPGASGTIAAEYVARAKPDGYTLLLFNSASNGVVPAVRKVSYKREDFELYGQYAFIPMVLIVKDDAPWKSFEEFIAYAKKHPGELKAATSGVATSSHLGIELINRVAGVKIVHLPFKSGPEVTAAILGGHAHLGLEPIPAQKGVIEAGKFRVLAQASEKRLEEFPDVPTFIEKGYPELKWCPWHGIAGPKGVPEKISGKLKDAFSIAFQHKEVVEMLKKLGFTPNYRSADDFTKFVREDEEKFSKIAKEANIRLE